MTVTPIFRSIRDPIGSAARWAVHSVPDHLSARRLAVPVWAALLLPSIALLPLASPWASYILAPVFALAAGLRLAALVGLFLPKPPEPPPLADADLPAVTVLVPLFREAAVMPDLVAAVARLDYPARLLEVMLLLEEADTATIAAARAHAPAGWRTIAVPPGSPQTKPRACNVGLALAGGDVVVVFDGEDRPDPEQPRRAAAALAADTRLAVVQAKLGCDHAGRGSPIVTRLWALEYAALFGAVLPLLSRLGLPFLLLGYASAVALHAAAAPRAGLPVWLALLLPFYWVLHNVALLLALSDLVRDPAHWRKTEHGVAAQRSPTPISGGLAGHPGIPCPLTQDSGMFAQCSQETLEETA